MADQKKKKLTLVQQEYQELAKKHEPPRPLLSNFTRAFLVGGVICLIGQALQEMFIHYFHFTEKTAGNPTVAVLIFISALLTGIGLYDRIGQWAGAGTSVPVTGFANSIASAAIDHRSEGLVLGVGGNMFKLAGSVILFGVGAAFLIGLIKTLIKMGG
ncbi:stage V sporulation protein AC [Brevibacillus centrosporus]|uniref:Stage V sporulation protein AC n=1 Tax=Brevibacillus centrosporus TaxID=54910 RepID=A0A1I3ZG56_9BACL|nr:stage V sporulation protein AC [Brevibacillus centrosporus]MEC2132851.1 stage V sporulation protein AC [Brevibacillus centrosporus]MED4911576.1 stage V sporulation protein AC [Brevibacillus centrosporus]RNB64278.1 stage V sporulation protein AC [Brevibacillus centrosporus]SFK43033.1 stage V sporulation protein AC [Brevibacillus centrosporus]GED32241.1 stage V sporulation protein AC [Brevibacillus centrosporus]